MRQAEGSVETISTSVKQFVIVEDAPKDAFLPISPPAYALSFTIWEETLMLPVTEQESTIRFSPQPASPPTIALPVISIFSKCISLR